MYTDIEIQDLDICHRGACHDHKEECETCTLHYEVVCDLLRRHCLQYKQSCRYHITQVFRIDNKKLKKQFQDKQAKMRKENTVIKISDCGVNEVNGTYNRDPSRPENFQRLIIDHWIPYRNQIVKMKEYIIIAVEKSSDGRQFWWCIDAVQMMVAMKNVINYISPQKIASKRLFYAPLSNEETPPLGDCWQAAESARGQRIPKLQILSRKVVVNSASDLESATRNYYREYFFRHSLDGRNISNHEIMDHISNVMTGKDAPNKADVQKKNISWQNLIKSLLVDIREKPGKLKAFMQKQSEGANIWWAWHGTDTKAVDLIASNNFDNAFCKRQVHGKGHYFAPDPHMALRYAKLTHAEDGNAYRCLLLCQVLLGNTTASRTVHGDSNTHQDFCYVLPESSQIWPVYVVVVRCS